MTTNISSELSRLTDRSFWKSRHRKTRFLRREAFVSQLRRRRLVVEPLEDRRLLAMLTVDTFSDVVDGGDNFLSLREAIDIANGNGEDDIIHLAAGTYALSLSPSGEDANAGGDLDIGPDFDGTNFHSLTILGNPAVTPDSVIDASGLGDRVLHVLPDADLTIVDVIVTGGSVPSGNGGGILNEEFLRADHSLIHTNTAVLGGGLYNDGTAHIVNDSEVANNTADEGGGIYNGGVSGSIISLEVQGSSISQNTAREGGGIYNESGADAVILDGSSIALNQALNATDGGIAEGGGIWNGGFMSIHDSSVFGNTAQAGDYGGYGGATAEGGGIWNSGSLFIDSLAGSSSSIDNNLALADGPFGFAAGGGIYNTQGGYTSLGDASVAMNRAQANDYGGAAEGGGVYNNGNLNSFNSSISQNTAAAYYASGGGVANGGGGYQGAFAFLERSEINNNAAVGVLTAHGGGISNTAGGYLPVAAASGFAAQLTTGGYGALGVFESAVGGNQATGGGTASAGGGLYNAGTAGVVDSTVQANEAGLGGGIYNDGATQVESSTLAFNRAHSSHGGAFGLGGGIFNAVGGFGENGPVGTRVLNSTITENESEFEGGGLYNQFSGEMDIDHATISHNRADTIFDGPNPPGGPPLGGGGIYNNVGEFDAGVIHIHNTIVALNAVSSGGTDPDVQGFFGYDSLGYNLIGDVGSAAGFGALGDKVGGTGNPVIDPLLGPLQDNGGPTHTRELLPDSPAFNMADPSNTVSNDQRGESRPRFGQSDIGAFEQTVRPPTRSIHGTKYLDLNQNGLRDTDIIAGDEPDVVFVIDVSGSTSNSFQGSSVGDINGDSSSDTILDAELAGFLALNQELIDRGFGNNAEVAIVLFGSSAASLDMDPSQAGKQLSASPLADTNNNGLPDVEDLLRDVILNGHRDGTNVGNTTDYEDALNEAISVINSAPFPVAADNNVIFLSDGFPNSQGSHADEATTLQTLADNVRAFGAGSGADLAQLQIIDPNAQVFTSTDELLDVFSGTGDQVIFTEPGLNGWTIHLFDSAGNLVDTQITMDMDLNGDGQIDPFSERGLYWFQDVPDGDYTIGEELKPHWGQSEPQPPASTVINPGFDLFVTDPGTTVVHLDFDGPGGNPPQPVPLQGVPFGPGGTDTIVERSAGTPHPQIGGEATIPIEIVALSLRSVAPIVIPGQPGQWDLQVMLDPNVAQQPGQMTILRDDLHGGSFWSELPVAALLTFAQVGNPTFQFSQPFFDVFITRDASWSVIPGAGDPRLTDPQTAVQFPSGGFFPGINVIGVCPEKVLTREQAQLAAHGVLPAMNMPAVAPGVHHVTMVNGAQIDRVDFGNYVKSSIHGYKFEDMNVNGNDDGDPRLGGVEIVLTDIDGVVIDRVRTDGNGEYWFSGLPAGTYVVSEVPPFGSTPTTPTSFTVTVGPGEELVALPGQAHLGSSMFRLDSSQEVQDPPVSSLATGTAKVLVAPDGSSVDVWVEHDVSNPIGAHIHRGAAGTNGPIIVDLGNPTSPIHFVWDASSGLTTADLNDLLAGNLYINVHSNVYPGGEVRGQIPADPRQEVLADPGVLVFGNAFEGSIHGYKFEDLDADGVWDVGEPPLAGVTIEISGSDGFQDSIVTNAAGEYWFQWLTPGVTYTVNEVVPPGMVQSTIDPPPLFISSGKEWVATPEQGDTVRRAFTFPWWWDVVIQPVDPSTGQPQGEPLALPLEGMTEILTSDYLDLNGNFLAPLADNEGIALAPPPMVPFVVETEIVSMSLHGSAPVQIGGSFFDVFVELDPGAPQSGLIQGELQQNLPPLGDQGIVGDSFFDVFFDVVLVDTTTGQEMRLAPADPGDPTQRGAVQVGMTFSPTNPPPVPSPIPPGDIRWMPTFFWAQGLGRELRNVLPDGTLGDVWDELISIHAVPHSEREKPVRPMLEPLLAFGNYIPGSIHGFKYEDADANGMYNPNPLPAGFGGNPITVGDQPRGGVEFVLTGTDGMGNSVGPLSEFTNSDGEFWFTGLKPGTYTVTEVLLAPYEASTPTSYTVTISSGEEYVWKPGAAMLDANDPQHEVLVDPDQSGFNEGLMFGNFIRSSIHAFKYNDIDGDGEYDPADGEAGVGGVTFLLDGIDGMGNPVMLSDATDPDGKVWFTGLKPGSYTLTEVVPAGSVATTPTTFDTSQLATLFPGTIGLLVSGEELVPFAGDSMAPPPSFETIVDPELLFGNRSELGSIHGFKFEDLDADGVYEPADGDRPMENVAFDLVDAAGISVGGMQFSDPNGEFWFLNLPPGTYTVREHLGMTDTNNNGIIDDQEGLMPSTPITTTVDVGPGEEWVWRPDAAMLPPNSPQHEVLHDPDGSGFNEDLMFGNFIKGSIHGFKFEDLDADGVYEPADGDVPMQGVHIELLDATGAVADFVLTNAAGEYWFTGLVPGGYVVQERLDLTDRNGNNIPDDQEGLMASTATGAALTIRSGEEYVWQPGAAMLPANALQHEVLVDPDASGFNENLMFGNFIKGSIHGQKFYDRDADGVQDAGEEGLNGWTIQLSGTDGLGNPVNQSTTTMSMDLDGNGTIDPMTETGLYWFTNLVPGTYTISEVGRIGWIQTTPVPLPPGTHTVVLTSGQTSTGNDFGNHLDCLAFDFNTSSSPTQTGYIDVNHLNVYPQGFGYGWVTAQGQFDGGPLAGPRDSDLLRDGHFGSDDTFQVDLPNGSYVVNIVLGDNITTRDKIDVYGEGTLALDDLNVQVGQRLHRSFPVTVSDGQLNLRVDDDGGSDTFFTVNAIKIWPAPVNTHVITHNSGGTFDVSGATPNSVVTVRSTVGTVTTADADPNYQGVQVVASPTGTFSFTVDGGSFGGAATLTSEEIDGHGSGTGSHTFAAQALRIDFNTGATPGTSPTAMGFVGLGWNNAYVAARGYGWVGDLSTFDLGGPTDLLRDGHYAGAGGTFLVDVAAGTYFVNVTLGDGLYTRDEVDLFAEGTQVADNLLMPAGQHVHHSFTTTVTDGQLTLFFSNGGNDPYFTVNSVEIRAAVGAHVLTDTSAGAGTSFSGTGASPNTLITVETTLGAVTSGDATGNYKDIQVLSDGSGNFSFTLAAPAGGIATITTREVTGAAQGSTTHDYGPVLAARRYDFNGASNITAAGFTGLRGSKLYNAVDGYGFLAGVPDFDQGSAGAGVATVALYQDLIYNSAATTFRVDAVGGTNYDVRVYTGNRFYNRDNFRLSIENGAFVAAPVNTGADFYTTVTLLNVSDQNADGFLDIKFENLGGDPYFVVNGVDVAESGPGLPPAAPEMLAGLTFDLQGLDAGSRARLASFQQTGATLTPELLAPVVAEAITQWSSRGLSADQLTRLTTADIRITDLNDHGALGLAGSRSILLDDNALGLGWHLGDGATPANQLDILTVVSHELGHLLGYGDEDPRISGNSLMTGTLSPGVSRLSSAVTSPLSSSPLRSSLAHDELFSELGQRRHAAKSAASGAREAVSEALLESLSVSHSPVALVEERGSDEYDGRLWKRDRHQADLDDLFAELAEEDFDS